MIKVKRVWLNMLFGLIDPQRLVLRPGLSRCRNRFLNDVNADRLQFEKDRNEVLLAHVTKNENGEPQWQEQNGEVAEGYFDFTTLESDKFATYKKDVEELLQEEFVYEETEANKAVFDALKLIFVELDVTFQNQEESFLYDNLCEQLEISLDDTLASVVKKIGG
jgi:hypothetical protein